MNIKRYVFLSLFFVVITSCFNTNSFAESNNEFQFKIIDNSNCSIIAWDGIEQNLVLPLYYNNIPVTIIADEAFKGKSQLISVTLPETIKTIGKGAFCYCDSLETVILPEGIEKIPENAFRNCKNLKNINIPSTIKEIGKSSFASCAGLTELELPEGIVSIGDYAFDSCTNLISMQLPSTLSSISGTTFVNDNSLQMITVATGNQFYSEIDGVLYTADKKEIVCYPIGKPGDRYEVLPGTEIVGEHAFRNSRLKSIVLPDSIIQLGKYAFFSADNIEAIIIPEKVKELPDYLFAGGVTSIQLPDSLEIIGEEAFQNCSFEEITIPNKVNTIKLFAFCRCKNLKKINIPNSVKTIEEYAFNSCTNLEKVLIPEETETLKYDIFYDCNKVTVYVYSGSIAEQYCIENDLHYITINDQSFDISGLMILELPFELKTIEDEAFRGCLAQVIIIPYGCTRIGSKAFANCPNLQYVFLPKGISISSDALQGSNSILIYQK